jgi:hypothetical protein
MNNIIPYKSTAFIFASNLKMEAAQPSERSIYFYRCVGRQFPFKIIAVTLHLVFKASYLERSKKRESSKRNA